MGRVSAIRFEGCTCEQAAAFIELHAPSLRWAEWGGQRALAVVNSDGKTYSSSIAYVLPERHARGYGWPLAEHAEAVVKLGYSRSFDISMPIIGSDGRLQASFVG